MCHLTATGQTRLRDVTHRGIYRTGRDGAGPLPPRGPPARDGPFQLHGARRTAGQPVPAGGRRRPAGRPVAPAVALDLRPRYLVSTIYPSDLGDRPLEDIFVTHHPEIYYSIYSMSERFRRRWLPKALPAEEALDRLASWQRSSHKIVKLHHAYIAGENDTEGDVHAICDALEQRRLMVHVNIVRYNPHDPRAARRRAARGDHPAERGDLPVAAAPGPGPRHSASRL